jgi:hypothetical protein
VCVCVCVCVSSRCMYIPFVCVCSRCMYIPSSQVKRTQAKLTETVWGIEENGPTALGMWVCVCVVCEYVCV